MRALSRDAVAEICRVHGDDRSRLIDVLLEVQRRGRCVDPCAAEVVALRLGIDVVDVRAVVSFYTFLTDEPTGRVVIRLCDDVIDEMHGAGAVARALEDELGIPSGATTSDGEFTLLRTSCIGLSDQAPAALIEDVPVIRLRPGAARELIASLRKRPAGADLRDVVVSSYGDGNNAHDLVRSMVSNQIRLVGDVLLGDGECEAGLARALALSPAEVIREIKTARLRGRGGAGFPTGIKWEHSRAAEGQPRYLICNADEGEPGTFKDRVLLTERPDLVFEGMTLGGYAIGAEHGILYLRAEYAYLRPFLEDVLARRRDRGLLGPDVLGRGRAAFDIRIQMGAGAYICGEETALINSCEGLPGDPRDRPPFPTKSGLDGRPTVVDNVETLCCAARILERGSGWFTSHGTRASAGTKLLSVAGDCTRPGIYEVPFGIRVSEVFRMSGAPPPRAAQIGGPSGTMIGPPDFDRTICFDDLPTGGAFTVFGKGRDPLHVVERYLAFFVHESCGYCTPCRVGNRILLDRLAAIRGGRCAPDEAMVLRELAETVIATSRCGLGQTSPRPVLGSLEAFPDSYAGAGSPGGER